MDHSDISEKEKRSNRVPVTLITGFLGSGKTTLLNYILTAHHGKRIMVIENEFGNETGIEKLIAQDGKGGTVSLDDQFVELSNGCICCTVRDNLVTTLEAVMQRSEKFDYILIETTGLANPGNLVDIFWLDEELESALFLDAMVCVVDLVNLEGHLDDPRKQSEGDASFVNEAEKQIVYADRVILNKTDLVSDEDVARIIARIKNLNPFAQFLTASFSAVDLDSILNLRCYEVDTLRLKSLVDQDSTANRTHDTSIRSVVVRESQPCNLQKLERWFGKLLWETEEIEIFRIKGIVSVADSPQIHVIQGVNSTFGIEPSSKLWTDASVKDDLGNQPLTKIVFIGRNLDLHSLEEGVRSCTP